MREDDQIHGELMTPCFTTEADFEAGYKESPFYVEGDYLAEYRKHMIAMSHIANVAKSYILNNWQRITDWSNLEVTLRHGLTGDTATYYLYRPLSDIVSSNENIKSLFEEVDAENKKRHNPISTVSDVVLDPTDGDFSITVNDTPYWWLEDQSVIIIADYIEKQLTSKS